MDKVIVRIETNEPMCEVVKKIMADKNAFREALTNGTVKEFAKNKARQRKTLSALR